MIKFTTTIYVLLLLANVSTAQENKVKVEKKQVNKTVEYKFKKGRYPLDSLAKPKIYVDGKHFDFDISLIDQNQIESLSIVKGLEAKEKYNAPHGVYLIRTKQEAFIDTSEIRVRIQKSKSNEENQPLFIIDGKVVKNPNLVKQLSPDDIESIEVLKDEKAKTFYNAENGVIIIKTKKGEK